jgi:hypothetical protein
LPFHPPVIPVSREKKVQKSVLVILTLILGIPCGTALTHAQSAPAATPAAAIDAAAPAATKPAALPETSAATAAAKAGATTPGIASPELIKQARSAGYKAHVRDGVSVFCIDDAPTGSLLAKTRCITQDQLQATLLQRQQQHNDAQQQRPCGATGCVVH